MTMFFLKSQGGYERKIASRFYRRRGWLVNILMVTQEVRENTSGAHWREVLNPDVKQLLAAEPFQEPTCYIETRRLPDIVR